MLPTDSQPGERPGASHSLEKELDSYRFWFSMLLLIAIFLPIGIIQHYEKREYKMVLDEIGYWKEIHEEDRTRLDIERDKNYRLRSSVVSLKRSLDRKTRKPTFPPVPRNDLE